MIPRRKIPFLALAALLLFTGFHPAAAETDPLEDLELIRTRVWNYNTGASYNIDSIFASLGEDGSWPDVNYAEIPAASWSVATHYTRILNIATVYRRPGHAHYNDPVALDAAARALRFGHTIVYAECPRPGNWWSWEIGVPQKLGPALLLLQGALDESDFLDQLDTYKYLIYPEPHMTGANLLDSVMNHLYLALIERDDTRLSRAREAVAGECVTHPGAAEGIKPDYSFHQHGAHLHNGSYGLVFENGAARYGFFTRDTGFALGGQPLETFAASFLDGTRWMIYNNYYEPSCRGRDVTRGDPSQMGAPLALLLIANAPIARQNEAIAAAKRFMEIRSTVDSRFAALLPAIQNAPVAAAELYGHKHFPDSDFSTHRRSAWFASLKMLSQRTKSSELVNGEGLQSWHLSDGALWIFLDGRDYYTNNTLPTLDWHRIPGTTVGRKALAAGQGYGYGQRVFVGGVALGDFGFATMDFRSLTTALSARKTWLFTPEAVVCAGEGVTSTEAETPIETIIMQRRLASGAAIVTVDGSTTPVANLGDSAAFSAARWAHAEDIGYYFLMDQPLRIERAARQGRWVDLNVTKSSTVYENPILTLWIEHGAQVQNGRYGYVIAPRKTAAQMSAFAAAPPVALRALDERIHAIEWPGEGALGAVFWAPGRFGEFEANAKCLVLRRRQGADYQLALCDPGRQMRSITLTIYERLRAVELPEGAASEPAADGSAVTRVNLPLSEGRAAVARFTVEPARSLLQVR